MKRSVLLAALAVVLLSGCFFRRARTNPAPGDPAAAPPPPTSGSVTGDPRELLGDLEQTMRGLGYQRVGPAQRNPNLPAGSQMAYRVDMQAGYCYSVVVLGAPGTNPNLLVRNPNGDNAAYNVDPDSHPWATVCPTAPGRHTAIIQQPPKSSGEYYFTVYQGPGQQKAELASFFAKHATASANGQLPPPTSSLDQSFALLGSDMQARGYQTMGEHVKGTLAEGSSTDFRIELEGGKCYAVVAVGGAEVRDLDLVLMSESGKEIDRDLEAGSKAIVRVCPKGSGTFSMKVKMNQGKGDFVYAPYQWPRGTKGPFDLEGLIYLRLGEVTSLLSQDGYEPDADFMPEKGSLRPNGTAKHTLKLAAGQCYAILVVGGDGVHDIDLSLRKGGASLAEDSTQSAFPSVRHCTDAAGEYTVEVKASRGSGEYFHQVFRRSGT